MTAIAITGINSYFAGTVLPKLEADSEIERIIGIDVTPWKGGFRKVVFHQRDVRDPGIGQILQGVDTVMHLAFIVEEIHDKKKTHDININGSINVFKAAAAQRVRKLIYTSSIASYGAHPDNPIGMTEEYPQVANVDSYYSSDKVEVERYLRDFESEHPDIILTVFRPPVIVGPNLRNVFADFFDRKATLFLRGRDPLVQFLHEEDLGEALHLAVKKELPGVYNIAADGCLTLRKAYEMAGVKLIDVPGPWLKRLSNAFFALHLEKISQGWVSLMEHPIIVSSEKFKRITGWQPKFTTVEAFQDFLKSRRGQ